MTLMSEKRKAADEEEVTFYETQTTDVKLSLATAKQMQEAASRNAARI
jgi:hypothetical protein